MGIIFGELTCEWSTGMERISILRGLRAPDILCPLDPVRYQREVTILKALLSHDPQQRPSADELSHLLPSVVHKSYTRDAVKLLDDDTNFRGNILTSLFSKTSNLIEYTYDAKIAEHSHTTSMITAEIISVLAAIFRRHGAIERTSAASLLPLNTAYNQRKNVVKLLDGFGNVLQLPYDFKIPLARRIARYNDVFSKSFVIGTVFRSGEPAPRTLLEADFDIVCKNADEPDFGVETLRVAFEIVQDIPVLEGDVQISLGHSAITKAVLRQAKVRPQDLASVAAVCHQLSSRSKRTSLSTWRRALATMLSETSIQELLSFISDDHFGFEDHVLQTLQRIVGLDSSLQTASDQLDAFRKAITMYKINIPVKFQVFTPNATNYGLTYTLEYGHNNVELLCIGGSYDELVRKQRLPGATPFSTRAAGFTLSVDKLVGLVVRRTSLSQAPRSVDVIIKAFAYETQAVDLVTRLWDAKMSAEICFDQDVLPYAQERRARFILSFRDRRYTAGQQVPLKIKNLIKDETEEITIDQVETYLLGELATSSKRAHALPIPRLTRTTSSRKEPDVIIISNDEHRKMKLPQRQLITNKAIELVQELNDELREANVPILVVDFDAEQMHLMRSFLPAALDEAAYRRISERLPAVARAHFNNMKDQVAKLRAQEYTHAFLYSFRSSELLLLQI